MSRHRESIAVALAATLAALVVLAVPVDALKVVFALPLCLLAPGHVLLGASTVGRWLDVPMRILLTVALSLAVLALASVLLGTVVKLDRSSWTLGLLAAILVGCVAAVYRPVVAAPRLRLVRVRVRPLDAALIAAAGVACVIALVITRTTFAAPKAIGYTQLWMVPAGPDHLTVGVRSAEQHAQTYRVEIRSGDLLLRRFDRVVLRPGGRFERRVSLPDIPRLTALVFREEQPATIYRRVTRGFSPTAPPTPAGPLTPAEPKLSGRLPRTTPRRSGGRGARRRSRRRSPPGRRGSRPSAATRPGRPGSHRARRPRSR